MVATTDAVQGLLLWAVAMISPVLMMYIDNSTFRLLFLTLVFPTILSFLCRAGHFWVSHKVVLIASVVTFIVSLMIKMSQKADDAMSNPSSDKTLSGIIFGSIVTIFLVTMFASSQVVDMYLPGEFAAGETSSNLGNFEF